MPLLEEGEAAHKEAPDGTENRRQDLRHGALHEAQGGPALHPRPGPLRGRHPAARDAVHGHRAQPSRARQDQVDQRRASAEDPGRPGGDHRRDPGQVQPALDAHHIGRHADGAADRPGHVPGAGSGRGDRHRALHRRRRRGRGGRRVRGAPAADRPVQVARAGRTGAAYRQGRQEGQPRVSLGGRATAPTPTRRSPRRKWW